MRLAVVVAIAALITTLLPGCASWENGPDPQADPNHKQFVTGSRIAYKGRGGLDSVKTVSREGVADQMRARIEALPNR